MKKRRQSSNGHKEEGFKESALMVAADMDDSVVLIVNQADGACFAMPPQMARLLADMLIGSAQEIERSDS